MGRQKFETIEMAQFYVVELLSRFMLTQNLYDKAEDQQTLERDPLAIQFLKAQSRGIDGSEKIKILKKLGDTSLYISGFFGDSLNRKVIDLDYYREMGSIAYRMLSDTIRDESFHQLYHELYNKFSGFVDVLTEVSQDVLPHNNQNLLRLYEIYVRTGSETVKKQLSEKGLPTEAPVRHSRDKKNA